MEEVTRVRDWHCRYVPMTDNDLTCWPCSPLSQEGAKRGEEFGERKKVHQLVTKIWRREEGPLPTNELPTLFSCILSSPQSLSATKAAYSSPSASGPQ